MYRTCIHIILAAGLFLICCAGTQVTKRSVEARLAFESGKQYAQDGLYDQAIVKLKEAVAEDPSYAAAYMNLGVVYIQKGKDYYATARESLEKAARLPEGAKDPLVWYNLTVIYTLMGVFDKAFEALDRSLAYGFKEYDALRTDEDLYELRRKQEFRKILEQHNVFL
jgi:Tfp pilus assembly protein PilF